jgi:hypothetical protein
MDNRSTSTRTPYTTGVEEGKCASEERRIATLTGDGPGISLGWPNPPFVTDLELRSRRHNGKTFGALRAAL